MEPGAAQRGDGDQIATLKAVLPYLWPAGRADLKARVVLALLSLVLAKVITVLSPFAFKYAVDALTGLKGTASPDATAVLLLAGPLAMVVTYGVGRIMMVVFGQLRDALFAKVGQSAVRALAIKTFRHLHNLSLKFHLERRTGGLSRIIERGTKGIDTILRYSLFNTFPTMIEILFVAGILWWNFGWIYALVILLTIIVYTGFTYWATEWRINLRRVMNDADTDANTKAIDSLINFETVKYFGNETHEAARFDRSLERYEKAAVKTWISLAILNAGQAIVFTIGLAVIMIMVANDVTQKQATVGDFVMVNALMIQLYMPLNFLGSVYRDIKQGLIDIEQMFDLLAVDTEIKDAPGANPLIIRNGEISFERVSFAYDRRRPIIRDLTITIPPGKTFAIVGPSGAGKSTISRLLYRFYDVTGGKVLIDGQDISKVTQQSLRSAVGMVPQDTVLFNDTIRYNIRYGRPDASDEEVYEAAKLAHIHDFVSTLPNGYDTMVGERGLKLSGGEKQRVSIARTILKGPPILMLDEATSALDTRTEQEIQKALRQVSQDRTTIVIAHRLSTVVDADEIIVLEGGRIAERGKHTALLERKGIYHAMWTRQREADEARRKLAETSDDGDGIEALQDTAETETVEA
ncbi:MAG TPA: ABC transporter ATP-binding protein/permease [Aestuariivirgaceae bacterium]|nr:ABC transporter ATP-binding protein/permease [Aestuariivirgaceae bacterium]